MTTTEKKYPHFTPGETPNRKQRRIDAGVNKRTLHKPNGITKLLVIDCIKYKQYLQIVPVLNKKRNVISYRKIIHTQPI